jgi:DNA-binding NarL/FixJ family response regulator
MSIATGTIRNRLNWKQLNKIWLGKRRYSSKALYNATKWLYHLERLPFGKFKIARTMVTTLFLIDDHPMVCNGFKQFISARHDLKLIGEASSGHQALAQLELAQPDLLVVDLHLPDMNGLSIVRAVQQKWPAIKILVFSADSDREIVDQALRLGVSGYVLKNSLLEELARAIDSVMMGRLYFSTELCTDILEDYRKALCEPKTLLQATLPERDREMIRLIADGLRSKEIASRLGLSVKSIETYRSRLMRNLGCKTTADLIRYAIREGLVVP